MAALKVFVRALPDSSRAQIEAWLDEAPERVGELKAAVRAHVAEGRAREREGEDVDAELARRIGSALHALLDDAGKLDVDGLKVLSAAVRYFVDAGDDAGDFDTFDGFADDAEVVAAAAEALARPDLVARIRG